MEAPKPLKSLNSNIQTYVTFVNRTSRLARAWWLDFSGNPVSYGDISPSQILQMNTFLSKYLGNHVAKQRSVSHIDDHLSHDVSGLCHFQRTRGFLGLRRMEPDLLLTSKKFIIQVCQSIRTIFRLILQHQVSFFRLVD